MNKQNKRILSSYIYSLIDQMSIKPELFVKGEKRYITNFGILMTLVSVCIIISSSICLLIQFYAGEGFTAFEHTMKNNDAFIYDINNKPFIFSLVDLNTQKRIDPRYLNIVPTYFKVSSNKVIGVNILDLVNITTFKNLTDPLWQEVDSNLWSGIRSKNENLTLFFNPSITATTYYLNIYVQLCQNTTSNNNSCFSRDLIINYTRTANIYLQWSYPDISVDHNNKTDPLQRNLYMQRKKIVYDFKYVYTDYINLNQYTSDDGIIFRNNNYYYEYGRDYTESELNVYPNSANFYISDSLLALKITPSTGNHVRIFNRSYPKLTSVIANISGLINFISSVFTFISLVVTSNIYFHDMTNFCIYEEENENIKNSSNNDTFKIQKFVASFEMRPVNNNICNNNYFVNNNEMRNFKIRDPKKANRKLTVYESICCICWLTNKRSKIFLDQSIFTLKKLLSVENILINEVDTFKMKDVLFDTNQRVLFNFINDYTVDQYVNMKIEKDAIRGRLNNMTPILDEALRLNDKMTNAMLDKILLKE